MPSAVVESMLPYGFCLGPQTLTRKGTHPVVLFFQEMVRAHMTIPSLLPNMTYHEQIVGIPYTYVNSVLPWLRSPGPFFYMPNLFLSEWLPTIGGQLYWGFNKQVAPVTVTDSTWTVFGDHGEPVIGFRHRLPRRASHEWKPVARHPYPNFDWFSGPNGLMVQPLLSQMPVGYKIVPVASNFNKLWDQAVIRPLEGQVEIHESFIPTLPTGRFPSHRKWAPSIARSPFGCFELLAPWRLTIPYAPEWTAAIPPLSTPALPGAPVHNPAALPPADELH
jgi:hypothetical protein